VLLTIIIEYFQLYICILQYIIFAISEYKVLDIKNKNNKKKKE